MCKSIAMYLHNSLEPIRYIPTKWHVNEWIIIMHF